MANLATINNNLLADSGIDPLSVVLGSGTANQIAYWIDADNIGALTTATYPSLTELSYVKGVTSSIQTQLNAKQNTLTLTTTGTSGAATLVGATLNIPQYQSVLTNPVTGTGTANYHAKWTSGSAIGNSLIYDDGTLLGINTTTLTKNINFAGTFRYERVYAYGNYSFNFSNAVGETFTWFRLGNATPFSQTKIFYRAGTSTSEEEGEIRISNTCSQPFIEWTRNTYNYHVREVRGRMTGGCGECEVWVLVRHGNYNLGANTNFQWQIHGGTDSSFAVANTTGTPGTGTTQVSINSTDLYFYNNSGNMSIAGSIAIGTAAPALSSKLFIEGNSIVLNTEGSNQAKSIYFRYSDGGDLRSDSFLTFSTGGTPSEKVRISALGNFSIGNTNDTHKLDVTGTGRFSGNLTVNNTITAAQSTAETAAIVATSGWSGTVDNPIITFGRTALAVAGAMGYDDPNTGLYIGTTTNHRLAFRTNNSDRIIISNTGVTTLYNLAGTGTRIVVADASGALSATSALSGYVTGSGTTNYVPKWTSSSAIGNSQIFDNATNVGIGVSDFGAFGLSLNNGFNLSFSEGGGDSYANIFRQRNSAATIIAHSLKRSSTAPFASSIGVSVAKAAIAVGWNAGSITFFSDPPSTVANGTDFVASERMTIVNSGFVGINTSTPQRQLDVFAAADNNTAASFGRNIDIGEWSGIGFGYVEPGNSNYRKAALVFERTGVAAEGKIHILNNQSADISSASLADSRLTILPDGKIGIGTGSPIAKFTVVGSGVYNVFDETLSSDAVIWSSEMTNDQYNSILQLVSVRQSLTTGSSSNGFLGFSTIDDSNAEGIRDAGRIAIVNESPSARNSATALSFWTNAGGTKTTAATEKVRITSGGKVGIGNTNPQDYSGDANTLVLGSTSTVLAGMTIANDTTGTGGIYFADGTDGTNKEYRGYFSYFHGTDELTIGTAGAVRVAIFATGQLQLSNYTSSTSFTGTAAGILGFTSAGNVITLSSTLFPSGSGTTNYVTKWTGANSVGNSTIFDNGTNVGINTTSMSYRLDVNGTVGTNESVTVIKSKSGNGIESYNLLNLRVAGTGAIGDATNIRFISADSSYTIANIAAIAGTDNVSYGTIALSVRNYFTDTVVESLRIDNKSNVGIGAVPDFWASGWRALQVGAGSAIAWTGAGANDFSFSTNSFFDSVDNRWEYRSTGDGAARYSMTALSGQHRWFTAPIGTANQAITFTQVMTLNQSGNLSIGNTNDTYKLDVTGTGRFSAGGPTTSSIEIGSNDNATISSRESMNFQTNNTGTIADRAFVFRNGGKGYTDGTALLTIESTGATNIICRAPDADRTLPVNVLTLTAEQGNAPYGPFGGSILFKNRSYVSGLVNSARIRSVIYDDGAPNNFGGGIWFETTPTPGGTLTQSLKIDYRGQSTFKSSWYEVATFNSTYGQSHIGIQNNGTGIAVFGSGVSVTSSAGANDVGIGTSGLNNAIVFATGTGYSERMRISSDGFVGINTTAPNRNLTVFGSTRHERVYGYGNNALSIPNSIPFGTVWVHLGTCGAFTTDKIYYRVATNTSEEEGEITISNTCSLPFVQWQRNTYNAMVVQVRARMTGGCGQCQVWIQVRYGSDFLGANTNLNWQAYNGTDSGFAIVNAIGTPGTGTSEKSIVGNEGYFYANSGSITVADNIGIATTAPSAKLHIDSALGNDAIRISDTTGNVRMAIGQEASYQGNYINTRNIDMKLQTYLAGGSGGNIIFQTQDNGTSTVSERMRITPSGNIGVNISNPSNIFSINKSFGTGSTQVDYLRLTSSQGGAWFSRMGLQFRWNDFGNGVAWNLGSIEGTVDGWTNPDGGGALIFLTKTFGAYATDPTEKMRLTAAGELWVGYTSDQGAYRLQVNGSTFSSTGFFESSDIRLKTILNRHQSINFDAIEYKWNDERDSKLHWGYAAQEVMKWLPDAVSGSEENYYTLDYNQVHTYKIAMLEKRIAELESQLKNK